MIRWITETLGTAPAGSPDIEPGMAIVDVRDLVDKQGNDLAAVRAKIDFGVGLLEKSGRVVVCCDYGISRSNSVAAGILARHTSISFDDAVREVRRATGEGEIKLEPLNVVRAALMETSTPPNDTRLRVLITGGSGFVGSALSRALTDSALVVAPTRQEVDLSVGAVALDQLVREHQISSLVHLANPRVYTSTKAIGEAVTMLRNALDVCRENRLRLLYLSSWEVYSGYRAKELLANESLPVFPKGPYGEAKMLCEELISHYRRHHALEAIIVRSSPVYGPASDRPKFIYNFWDKARTGSAIFTHEYANGAPHLDLLHIDDLIRALHAILETSVAGDFNLGSGQLVSTFDVAASIVKKTHSASEITMRQIDDFAPNIRMDYSRAERELGWRAEKTFDQSLDEIVRSGWK